VENLQYDRLCRSANSEAYLLSQGEEALGRVDLHFTADTVYGVLVVEREIPEDEIRALIDRVDEDLVWTANVPRDDFIVTVYQGSEIGVFSDTDSDDAVDGLGD
jgi:hypothetical protein